ncbi:MAG TPA: hypothetical protein VGD21_08660 [Lysobacter sp.]
MNNRTQPLTVLGLAACLAACSLASTTAVPLRWTPAPLSSDQYESSPTFTADGREVFFMRSDPGFSRYRILWSRCEHGAWTAPVEAPFSAPKAAQEADPFVTADGTQLYYVSSRHDPRGEDLDIWRVARAHDGNWGTPERLPPPVNSSASELLPRLAADGRLWFGSSRPGGYGQGDMYVASRDDDGRWRVANAGPPISTAANEYEAEVARDGRTLVVVADRGDRSHLYRYTLEHGRWIERGRVPADDAVFQVGPLLSPDGARLLFAQKTADRSGEWFVIDLAPAADPRWPPRCADNP